RTGSTRTQSTTGWTGGETKRLPVGPVLIPGPHQGVPATASKASLLPRLAGRKRTGCCTAGLGCTGRSHSCPFSLRSLPARVVLADDGDGLLPVPEAPARRLTRATGTTRTPRRSNDRGGLPCRPP